MTLKSTLTRIAVVGAASGAVIALGAASAQATDDWTNGTNLNCYTKYVIIGSTSTGTTQQAHFPIGGGLYTRTFANGSTYKYRISSFVKSIDTAYVETPGQISSASRFCDS